MLSFAADVRRELSQASEDSKGHMRAEGYGMLLGADVTADRIRLVTESIDVATHFAKLMDKLCRASVEVSVSGVGYLAEVSEDITRTLDFFYVNPTAIARRLSRSNIEEEYCTASFLRGLFLACGYVTSPEKGYRLEFVTRHRQLSEDIATLMRECDFFPSISNRRGMRIVYFKSGDAVGRLLRNMGASAAANAVETARDRRAVVNYVNRQMNTDTANMYKSLAAAARQVEAITALRQRGSLEFLAEDLLEIALLREQNPDATLGYLAELAGLPRSTLNRKLAKILDLAKPPKA